jgi:hypothetical protein
MRILLTARILFYRRFGIFRADSCCLLGAHNSLSVGVFLNLCRVIGCSLII